MAVILAVEPDERQAAILSGVIMNQLRADLVLVDSRDAAISRIRQQVPDLLLMTGALPRSDEDAFVRRIRRMKDAAQLQMLTIPQLVPAKDESPEDESGGLLRAFRRRRTEIQPQGCDPKRFAKEIKKGLLIAERLKAARPLPSNMAAPAHVAPPAATPTAEAPPARPVLDRLESAPPALTLRAIESRLEAAMRGAGASSPSPSASDAIVRALRVPPGVASILYPRGCRIDRVRLADPPKARPVRRPTAEPPPMGTGGGATLALH